MIDKESLPVGGGLVLWTIGEWTDLTVLAEGLDALGMKAYAPEKRTPGAVLKDVLETLYAKPTQLVRPLSSKDGFTVQEEVRGLKANHYNQLLAVKVDTDSEAFDFDPYDNRSQDIKDKYAVQRDLIKNAQVTACLVHIIEGSLNGTRLKPGTYWLPEGSLPAWKMLAEVVEKAAVGRPHAVYALRNVMDGDAVRAVQDAIVAEMSEAARLIEKDVLENDLGGRALGNRVDLCNEMLQKLSSYEAILHVGLESVKRLVEKSKTNAITAKLLMPVETA